MTAKKKVSEGDPDFPRTRFPDRAGKRNAVKMFVKNLCFAVLICSAFSLDASEESFAERGRTLDHFLSRTWERVSEAWIRCGAELQMASLAVTDRRLHARQDLESRTRIAGEKLVERAGEMAEEASGKVVKSLRPSFLPPDQGFIPGRSAGADSASATAEQAELSAENRQSLPPDPEAPGQDMDPLAVPDPEPVPGN